MTNQNMPMPDTNLFGQQQDSIMSMRWENKELIAQLWKNLAYMEVQYLNGEPVLKRVGDKNIKPPINGTGARAIINIVQSVVNPVSSLSKIHQDHAMILLRHIKRTTRHMVAMNAKEYECTRRIDKQTVLTVVENICFMQLMRPVGGHESNHSRSNYLERRDEGIYTSNNKKSWNPFAKNTGGAEQ